MNKQMKHIALFVLLHACIILFFLFVMFADLATPFISGFAADSKGRVYIGENNKIAIYQDEQLVHTIALKGQNYVFTVDSNDQILVAYPSRVYRLDINGNILDMKDDANSTMYSQLQQHGQTFSAANGTLYKKVEPFGWTKIVKNETEVVYSISTFSFFVKWLINLCALSMFINGAWLIAHVRKYHTST